MRGERAAGKLLGLFEHCVEVGDVRCGKRASPLASRPLSHQLLVMIK
ncbi:hypothetical protein [Brevibacillus dissolubilis]|nr:hypothetical protein [Brevibacillus dissolubilis]